MNPIYKFELERNGSRRQAFPVYKEDLAMEFAKESQQEFFRRRLSGKLTFLSEDYTFISQTVFDTKFRLFLSISYDLGQTWIPYWQGEFWKTDCEFSEDDQTCIVTPAVMDGYTNILNGQDKEYDLIKLAPEMQIVHYDKRPMIQIYEAGSSTVGCWMAGMWWEQEVTEAVSDYYQLLNTYHFALIEQEVLFLLSGAMTPQVPPLFYGHTWSLEEPTKTYYNGDFYLRIHYVSGGYGIEVGRNNTDMWSGTMSDLIGTKTLTPIPGTGASGNIQLDFGGRRDYYARLVCDVDEVQGVSTYDIPTDDIVENNRNYRKCVGYATNAIIFTDRKVSTPTEWGLYQPNLYYAEPLIPLYYGEFYPCSRKTWNALSVWFQPDLLDLTIEQAARREWMLGDCFTLAGAIKVLLAEIAPSVSFEETSAYSEFLFGSQNPITGVAQTLLITPKSNVINAGYDQPAQKAPITLKTILDMLRDCFRCYWFVEDGKFRIEHISYFMRGGSYTGSPSVGRDLTEEEVTRNGKKWCFGKNTFTFNKPETFGRYEFGWMDDVTRQFEGFPIDILSGYVDKSKIEQVAVSQFTSDIDYVLLNPAEISKDGFVLMAAVVDNGEYKLPYRDFIYNYTSHILQNAYVAFMFLQSYYLFDMPAPYFEVNGEQKQAVDTVRLRQQDIQFPCLTDPDTRSLIKTGLGFGMLQKISVNLSSRNGKATLNLPTE